MTTYADHQAQLDVALRERFEAMPNEFDTKALHISDLTACVRAVWYRRNGHPEVPISPARRISMERGNAIELIIREALATQLESQDFVTFHETSLDGVMSAWIAETPDSPTAFQAGLSLDHAAFAPPMRAAIGHMDLYANHLRDRIIRIYEIKSMPFLGPAPQTKHVMQAAGYEFMVNTALPRHTVETYVIEVSAVTGEYRSHKLDGRAHEPEVIARLIERQWNTAPGDEIPDPSIPDEQFVPRGRAPNKRLVNLLCEKYCGYRMCPDNHVGEEAALVDE